MAPSKVTAVRKSCCGKPPRKLMKTKVIRKRAPAATKVPKEKPVSKKTASDKAAPSLPSTAQMVDNAIVSLKSRGGSTLPAIKKFISTTYKVDLVKRAWHINKYLNLAVDNGSLIRTKGRGANGSFKLAAPKTENSKKKQVTPKATKAAAQPKEKATKKSNVNKSPSKAKKSAKVQPK